MNVREVQVVIHREADSWWAEAPDLPGYSATAATRNELEELIREGLRFHLGEDDLVIRERIAVGAAQSPILLFDFVDGRVTMITHADDADLSPHEDRKTLQAVGIPAS